MAAIQLQPPPYEQFDCRAEGRNVRWSKWLRRLEQNVFAGCNIINPEQKKGLLLMYAGSDLNDIVDAFDDDVLAPIDAVPAADGRAAVPAQNVYQRLTIAITNHFNPQANTEFQKYLFKNTVQTSPDIDEFYGQLRQLAATCNFINVDAEIKSQLIFGCKMDKVRTKGLSEPNLALADLLHYARNLEVTLANSSAIKQQSVNALRRPQQQRQQQQQQQRQQNQQHQRHHKQIRRQNNSGSNQPTSPATQRQQQQQQQRNNKSCSFCGKAWHVNGGLRNCPARGKQCNKCGKLNHFGSVCMSAGINQVHEVPDEQPSYTFHLRTGQRHSSPCFNIDFGNGTVSMLADSGADVNLITESDYLRLDPSPLLDPPSTRILPYGDSKPIRVLGEFTCELKYNTSVRTTICVVEDGPRSLSLLSWDTSKALKLLSAINNISADDVTQIVDQFPELFTGLGKLKDYQVKLHIDDSVQPIAQTHRRIPFHVRHDLEKQLEADESLGVIERPTGPTPWVSPVVCVPKKNGKMRVCVDMRRANVAIKRERHTTPTITEIMNDLNGATVFSKLDLNQGYNQLELEPTSRYITTFTTHVGLRQFTRLNFGICSAAEVFQEAIRQTLSGIPGAINLSDDILVFGKTQAEHNANLKATLQRLKEKGLTLSREKCEFNKSSLQFFGHIFSAAGLAPDPEKIRAVMDMSAPKSAEEVRSLLGMTNYCGARFIYDYATITHCLRELTKKNVQFHWSQQHETAFKTLKTSLTRTPVLSYYDPTAPIELHVDASPFGLCAILMQTGKDGTKRTVQYASRALTPVEQRYSQTEREALAVVWACEHHHLYIMGTSVTIYTDHMPLLPIFNNPTSKPTARIERWTLRLQPYEFTLKYRSGKSNPADYLSRHIPDTTMNKSKQDERNTEEYINYIARTSTPKSMTVAEIESSTERDATLQAVIYAIQHDAWNNIKVQPEIHRNTLQSMHKLRHELTVTESGKMILRGSRIVIPHELQKRVVDLAHVGHQGIVKTKALIREKVWFHGIDSLVENTIRNCLACQVTTPSTVREPLNMSPLPERPWEELSIDFGQIPDTASHFLVIHDDYSRYAVVETVSSLSANAVIPVLDKIICEFGIPKVIKSDNGPPFNSQAFSDFARHKGFKHRKITPIWPLANGEVERFMRTVKKSMKAAKTENRNFHQNLNDFLLNYRTTPHSSTGIPPATALFGREVRSTLPQVFFKASDLDINQKDATSKAKMKSYADKTLRTKPSLKIGDHVLVRNEGKNKSKPPFNPKPLTITDQKGSMITAKREGKSVTRNSSFFKASPSAPGDVSSEEEEEDVPYTERVQPPVNQPETPAPENQRPHQRPQRNRQMPARFKDFIMK